MNIDDIERNLNNFEGDPDKIMSAVLNSLVLIQANVEILLETQISFYGTRIPVEDGQKFVNKTYADLALRIQELRASISAKI
jgi:hypothetical protein